MIDLWVLIYSREAVHASDKFSAMKQVEWPSVPQRGDVINVGISDDGDPDAFNAYVESRYFSSSGTVIVQAEVVNALEEYEDLKAALLRDGFTGEYETKGWDVRK